MKDTPLITQASNLIQEVKGKVLSMEERKVLSIELASLMLEEARGTQTRFEKRQQRQLARMMDDPKGKVFTTTMTDECFRSQNVRRVAHQMIFLLKKYGVPRYLSIGRRLQLLAFKAVGWMAPQLFVPLAKRLLRKETSTVILPGEAAQLMKHLEQRKSEQVRINLNHLGEAILGEEEACRRLQTYLDDLAKPGIEYISVKVSTICSQINLRAWEETLSILSQRLQQLYRAAMNHPYTKPDGTTALKFVNLDMEEYRDLHLTIALFCRVLDQPEFFHHSAGIVLQAYLPDASRLQVDLTEWAIRRVAAGGAPIKIRIVKGANLAMEQVDASLHGWPQTPYISKDEVDANYKRMVLYGCRPEHARAAHLGIASHNLFDIAFGILLRAENQIENEVCFEMLEGMAEPMRRVVQQLTGDILLYCPAATQEEFQNAVAYLIRRLDENTAPQNFLRQAFSLKPGTFEWDEQVALFAQACDNCNNVSVTPRRKQNRTLPPESLKLTAPFENEPDTDWAIPVNTAWVVEMVRRWQSHTMPHIPLVIDQTEVAQGLPKAIANDPSEPNTRRYTYTLASMAQVDQALTCAKKSEQEWGTLAATERSKLLANVAQVIRRYRGDLIGAMVVSCAKTAQEADVEVSEAIDFAEYYRRNLLDLQHLTDIRWKPKGTVVVAPPWNFPLSIPAGGILAALAAGNTVIFKPAREAVLIGWIIAQLCWEAGIPKKVLQFLTCEDESVGSALVKDSRVNAVILTGATATARLLLKMRPGLDLLAETGGKNSLIVTAMADRDLAVRDLIQSAFGHAGQKCSACSLAILETEIYHDFHFRQQLRDAASSLPVGPSWDFQSRLTPLIHPPGPDLLRALTTLEPGEEWLLEPKVSPLNPNLWTPGIKIGVSEGSFTHRTELFGPVLGVMRADNLSHAIKLANAVPYGLTAGIHTLDEREQRYWIDHIEAGNCYVNRGITGAIVQRQPFGGCKDSSFGRGAKAGGPNYLMQLMKTEQYTLPAHVDEVNPAVAALNKHVRKQGFSNSLLAIWQRSIGSYAFFWNLHFKLQRDISLILGQDNLFGYRPQPLILRVKGDDRSMDLFLVCAAALTCGTPIQISGEPGSLKPLEGLGKPKIDFVEESDAQFVARLRQQPFPRVRCLSRLSPFLQQALAELGARVLDTPPVANGRLELLNYLREMSISIDYHRYGNLGDREREKRAPLVDSPQTCQDQPCEGCECGRKD